MLVPVFANPGVRGPCVCPPKRIAEGDIGNSEINVWPPTHRCTAPIPPPDMWAPPVGWDYENPSRFIYNPRWPGMEDIEKGATFGSTCRGTPAECETALIEDLLQIGCQDTDVIQYLVMHHTVARHPLIGKHEWWEARPNFFDVVVQIRKSLKIRDDASNDDLGGLTEILQVLSEDEPRDRAKSYWILLFGETENTQRNTRWMESHAKFRQIVLESTQQIIMKVRPHTWELIVARSFPPLIRLVSPDDTDYPRQGPGVTQVAQWLQDYLEDVGITQQSNEDEYPKALKAQTPIERVTGATALFMSHFHNWVRESQGEGHFEDRSEDGLLKASGCSLKKGKHWINPDGSGRCSSHNPFIRPAHETFQKRKKRRKHMMYRLHSPARFDLKTTDLPTPPFSEKDAFYHDSDTTEHRVPLINGPDGMTVKLHEVKKACDISHTRGYEEGRRGGLQTRDSSVHKSYASGVIFGEVQPMDAPYCDHPDRCNSPDACGLTNVFQQMRATYVEKAEKVGAEKEAVLRSNRVGALHLYIICFRLFLRFRKTCRPHPRPWLLRLQNKHTREIGERES